MPTLMRRLLTKSGIKKSENKTAILRFFEAIASKKAYKISFSFFEKIALNFIEKKVHGE